MDTCICMEEPPHCSPETMTFLVTYTPIENVFGVKKINWKKISWKDKELRIARTLAKNKIGGHALPNINTFCKAAVKLRQWGIGAGIGKTDQWYGKEILKTEVLLYEHLICNPDGIIDQWENK